MGVLKCTSTDNLTVLLIIHELCLEPYNFIGWFPFNIGFLNVKLRLFLVITFAHTLDVTKTHL